MALAAAEGLDGGAAGVAGGGADDGDGAGRGGSSARSIRRASTCMATSLKASVGPWKSSRIQSLGPIWTRGATAGWRKVA